MKPSTQAEAMGKFHQVRGRLEEEVGRLAKHRELETRGKIEKGAGKVQEKIGQAEKLLGQ